MRRKRTLVIVVAVVVIVAATLGLFAAVGLISRGGSSAVTGSGTVVGRSADLAQGAAPEPAAGLNTGTATKSTSAESASGQDVAAAVPPSSAPSSHYLLRSGDLSLLVARGTLLATVDRIASMTAGMDGYVTSSAVGSEQTGVTGTIEPMPLDGAQGGDSSVRSGDAVSDPYATMTVRVPERVFDDAVKRFAKLGDVQSVSTSSEDVTSQYVDLQARLRHFRAVERRLVGFLADTANVNQMLAVQDRIDQVQLTIEELTAQLKSLSETTTYGTLSIYLREKGVPQAGAIDPSDTFGGTFWNSVKLLGHGARVTGLVLTALLPFIVVFGAIALAVWYGVRRLRRGRRQPAQPTLPA